MFTTMMNSDDYADNLVISLKKKQSGCVHVQCLADKKKKLYSYLFKLWLINFICTIMISWLCKWKFHLHLSVFFSFFSTISILDSSIIRDLSYPWNYHYVMNTEDQTTANWSTNNKGVSVTPGKFCSFLYTQRTTLRENTFNS